MVLVNRRNRKKHTMNNHALPRAAALTAVLSLASLTSAALIGVDAGGRVPAAPNSSIGNATFTFTVAVPFMALGDVRLNLDMVHSWTEDCEITLTGPTGIAVQLFNHRGGVDGFADFDDTYFDDSADTDIGDAIPPFSGSFVPEAALAAFAGTDPNGVWTLRVVDSYFGDYGYLYANGDPTFETRRPQSEGTYIEIDEQIPTPGTLGFISLAGLLSLRRRIR